MSEQTLHTEAFEIRLEDGLRLRGRVKTSADGRRKPVVVAAHGFRGDQDWGFWPEVTDRFAARGFYTVSFNFSRIAAKADGGDDDRVAKASTQSQEVLDIGEIVRRVKDGTLPFPEQADGSRIALLGHSRSGGSGIVYASEHPERVQALIVWNGGVSPVRSSAEANLTPVERAVALDSEANRERFNTYERFQLLSQPALVVQGDGDSERLKAFVELLKEQAPEQTYVSVPGADHSFNAAHPYEGTTPQLDAAFEETVSFLENKL